jgi:hypothetical protein
VSRRVVLAAVLGAAAVGATALRLRDRPADAVHVRISTGAATAEGIAAAVRGALRPPPVEVLDPGDELLRLLAELYAIEVPEPPARPPVDELLVEEAAAALQAMDRQQRATCPPGLHVPAWLPAGEWGWWIAFDAADERCVWAARPLAPPALVITERAAGWRLWEVLAAALPDRGACEACSALPCDEHGGDHPAEDPAADRTGWADR